MESLSPVLFYSMVFLFGVVFGSFANVIVDRLHTGRSLNDRSHCFSCGSTLDWYELFPLLSYLLLGGRCLKCKARIPGRFFVIELIMGLLFVLIMYKFGLTLVGSLSLVLSFLLLVIVMYDIRHFIIPNELVVGVSLVSVTTLVLRDGLLEDIFIIWFALLGAFLVVSVYGGLWLISKGRWIGFGDVKLVAALGLLIGFEYWFSFVVWSFWTGAVVSLLLIGSEKLLRKGKTRLGFLPTGLTMKSEVPFAPFLIVAFAFVYLFELNVLDLIAYVFAWVY